MAVFGQCSLIYINILSFVRKKERIVDAMLGKSGEVLGRVDWLSQGFFFYFSYSSCFSFPVLVVIIDDWCIFSASF
jgi:hypothetical protein